MRLFFAIFAGLLLPISGGAAFAPFAGSSIAEAERFIAENSITKLEDFLARLPEITRANFVLMRASASLQPTKDPLQPRAILYGADGKLVFAFNHTSNSIEMMESPLGAENFEFKRLKFTPQGAVPVKANCQACHNGRPLWGQYRSWAGMYGGDQEHIPSSSAEEKDYLAFTQLAVTDSLYKNLIFKCGTYYNGGITPGFVVKGAEGMPACRELRELVETGPGYSRSERHLYQPAEGFGEILTRWNSSRIYQRARLSENFSSLKYPVAANALGCLGERIYDYNQGDPEALLQLRNTLRSISAPMESKLFREAAAKGINETKLQAALYRMLGIDLRGDIRMDIRFDSKKFLGNDCDTNSSYAPNANCQPGNYGYDAYFDGYDTSANLVGYLALREIYGQDSALRGLLKNGLNSTEAHFAALPPDSGDGYTSRDSLLESIQALRADLDSPAGIPALIPQRIHDFPFAFLLRWGNGEGICRALLNRNTSQIKKAAFHR